MPASAASVNSADMNRLHNAAEIEYLDEVPAPDPGSTLHQRGDKVKIIGRTERFPSMVESE